MLDGRQQRRIDIETCSVSAHHGCEIKPEAIDAGARHPAPHRVHDELHDGQPVTGQRVAATGVIDQLTIGVAIIKRVVEPTETHHGATQIALARMIEDHVENDADARRMQGIDGLSNLRQPTRRQARIGRHETHGIITPGIGEADLRQMPLVDPGGDRHELNCIDTKLRQMRDDGGFSQCGDGAALFRRHIGVKLRKGLDRNFVDELWGVRWQRFRVIGDVTHNGLRHQVSRIGPAPGQIGMMGKGAVELQCVRVEQQLRNIEAMTLLGQPWTFGAKTVMRAIANTFDDAIMHITQPLRQGDAGHLGIALENAEEDSRCMARHDGNASTLLSGCDAERAGPVIAYGAVGDQVITVGAARPMRRSISGSDRDRAMRSAKASCVSVPWRLASGS